MCVAGGCRALFTFNRRGERGPFEARHLRLLEAAAPHVASALHAACVRAALDEWPASDTGFIVLGLDGSVELSNGTAARLLEQNGARTLGLEVFLGLVRRSLRGAAPSVAGMSFTDRATHRTYRLVSEPATGADGLKRAVVMLEPARPADREVGLLRLGL